MSQINARVRDKLWERVTLKWDLDAIMIYSTNTEQGFAIKTWGDPSRDVIDCDGLFLMQRMIKRKKKSE